MTNLPPVRLNRYLSDETTHLIQLAMPMFQSTISPPPAHVVLQAILAMKLELIFGNEGFGIPRETWGSNLELGVGRYFSGNCLLPTRNRH